MCGIVGTMSLSSSGLSASECKALWSMTVADTVRGGDGTGMFLVDKKGAPFYYKTTDHGSKFLDKDDWNDMAGGHRLAIAHNRAATLGSLSEDNSHPFFYGDIIGVHNGTIHSWTEFADEATMDSMAVFEALSKAEPDDESVIKLLNDFNDGAYSLVWYDGRSKELKLARNMDRPMHMGLTKRAVMLSSELGIMQWAAQRVNNGLHYSWSNDEDTLVSIPINGGDARVKQFVPSLRTTSSWGNRSSYNMSTPVSGYWKDNYDPYGTGYYGSMGDRWKDAWDDGWDEVVGGPSEADETKGSTRKQTVTFDKDCPDTTLYGYSTMLAREVYKPWSEGFVNGVDKGALEVGFAHLYGMMGNGHVPDNEILNRDATRSRYAIPYITGIVNEIMYGFVHVGDSNYPIVFNKADGYVKDYDKVRSITANGGVCKLPPHIICGIVLYDTGHKGYILGQQFEIYRKGRKTPEDIKPEALWPTTEQSRGKLQLYSVLNHPYRQASRLDKQPDWYAGWTVSAQLGIRELYKGVLI